MSWMIESYLNNRSAIKGRGEIDSDEFNDLMDIEKAIEYLFKEGAISDDDLDIIKAATSDIPMGNRHYKQTLYKKYRLICERIAQYLGGHFTDDGYVEDMRKKYGLTKQQVEYLQFYMRSKYKHKVMRKSPEKRKLTDDDKIEY